MDTIQSYGERLVKAGFNRGRGSLWAGARGYYPNGNRVDKETIDPDYYSWPYINDDATWGVVVGWLGELTGYKLALHPPGLFGKWCFTEDNSTNTIVCHIDRFEAIVLVAEELHRRKIKSQEGKFVRGARVKYVDHGLGIESLGIIVWKENDWLNVSFDSEPDKIRKRRIEYFELIAPEEKLNAISKFDLGVWVEFDISSSEKLHSTFRGMIIGIDGNYFRVRKYNSNYMNAHYDYKVHSSRLRVSPNQIT